jgi:hypothetical protein
MNPRILFPLLFVAAPLFAQGEVDLRTTAKKGSSVWLLFEQKQEQNIDAGGQQMEMANTTNRVLQLTVKDVDDKGNLIVETSLARVYGNTSMPMMGDVEFDSATAADDDGEDEMTGMMTKAMLAGAGKKFTAKVSALGKVVELMDDAKALFGGGGGPMGGGMDENQMKKMIEGAFGSVPEKPMAVGGKWTNTEVENDRRMPVKNNIEMTLSKCDAESYEVAATGTLAQVEQPAGEKADDGDDEDGMAAAMKSMKLKNGKASGSQKVSRTDGFLIEGSHLVTMDVEMSAGPMGDMAVAVKMTETWKRVTGDAAAPPKKAEKPADKAGETKAEGTGGK